MLRREFSIKKRVARARLYITAHGLYEARINGARVGDEIFTPGWTPYHSCLQYQTYDVTELLVAGDNAIGVFLGDGWYRGFVSYIYARNVYGKDLALLSQLEVTYQDGTTETIISDSSWRSSTGPILESDIFNGETYNALFEKTGWDRPGFRDDDWKGVREADFDPSILTAPLGVPVKKIEEIKPIEIINTPKGETVLDFGQNLVGFVSMKVNGRKGQVITLKHGEVLDRDGNFYNKNLRLARAEDTYVCKGGEEEEIFEPRFTFHGFRYVLIEGWEGEITGDSFTAVVVHSEMEKTGEFSCSNDLVNRLYQNIVWSQKGNFLDVPTDCPQRDERMGWTGDLQVFAPTACSNMDTAAFLTRWLRDLRIDQWRSGLVPCVIPDPFTKRWDSFKRVLINALRKQDGE
jgi:alpha-L-rhamnosidase